LNPLVIGSLTTVTHFPHDLSMSMTYVVIFP